MKKRNIGIVLVVIMALNVVSWISDINSEKSYGAIYYIIVLSLLMLGIFLIVNSAGEVEIKQKELDDYSPDKTQAIELKLKTDFLEMLEKIKEKVKAEDADKQKLTIEKSVENYIKSIKDGYPIILDGYIKKNVIPPFTHHEFVVMVDKVTSDALDTEITTQHKWKYNPEDWI